MAKLPEIEKKSGSLFDSNLSMGSADEAIQVSQDIISHGISSVAVAAFAVAVISLLAFVHVAFVTVSVLAALLAVFSMYLISRSGGELTGKTFACLALAVAIMSGVGGPVRKTVYRIEFEKQAAQFCEEWFKSVQNGDFVAVRQMTKAYWARATIMNHQDEIDYFVREKAGDDEAHHEMHSFLSNQTILTLWKLGDKARHSFYTASTTWLTSTHESTERIYAVTVDPDPEVGRTQKQTFFFRLVLNRHYNKTEEGERLVGWSTIVSDLNPMELDKDGRPIYQQQDL